MDMKGLVIPNKSSRIIKISSSWSLLFWNLLITLSMQINGWSAFIKFSFITRIPSATSGEMVFERWRLCFVYSILEFQKPAVLVVLYFFGKRWLLNKIWHLSFDWNTILQTQWNRIKTFLKEISQMH